MANRGAAEGAGADAAGQVSKPHCSAHCTDTFSLHPHSPAGTVDIVMQEQAQPEQQLRSFEPMNQDTLEAASPAGNGNKLPPGGIFLSVSIEDQEPSSTCLTPVSCGMDLELDLSMVANKGSMTLSVDVSAFTFNS